MCSAQRLFQILQDALRSSSEYKQHCIQQSWPRLVLAQYNQCTVFDRLEEQMQILKIMAVFQCLPLQYVIYAMQIQIIPAAVVYNLISFSSENNGTAVY
jgi:hypothetical protein